MKSLARTLLFILFFVLPLTVVAIYEIYYATDRYHSDSSIIITQEQGNVPTFDLSVIGLPAVSQDKDALVVQEFIQSLDMLNYLEDKLKLREHYAQTSIDWISKLPPNASLEDFHKYIKGYITADYDTEAKIIHVHVQAFDRDYAQAVLNAVIARSQEFIDKLNARVTGEQTVFFEKQLGISEQRLREVKDEVVKFQRDHRLLTTDSEAALIMENISGLEKLLTSKQAELTTKLQELSVTSPAIQTLKLDIASIQTQIDREKDRLSGGAGIALNELDSQFRAIQLNLEFVTNIYKSNLTQLEQARIEAIRRLKFLVVVTQPTLADSSQFPDRKFIIGSAAMVLLMIYFVLALIVAIIREHS
jgi:capsular polysaccharide transport system permease protein